MVKEKTGKNLTDGPEIGGGHIYGRCQRLDRHLPDESSIFYCRYWVA